MAARTAPHTRQAWSDLHTGGAGNGGPGPAAVPPAGPASRVHGRRRAAWHRGSPAEAWGLPPPGGEGSRL